MKKYYRRMKKVFILKKRKSDGVRKMVRFVMNTLFVWWFLVRGI